MTNIAVVNFNSGEISPDLDALKTIEKYIGGCRRLDNMIPDVYGNTTRRPGTEFIMATITYVTLKIFEVDSVDTGDGVYNCYEYEIDSTEWDGTAGTDKLDVASVSTTEVLNILENDPLAAYARPLAKGDRLYAWQMVDDGETVRWVGIPITGSPVRRAKTTAAAGAATTITANLYDNDGETEITSGLGAGITVYCTVTGSANLNAAIPMLENDMDIPVYNICGKWYCSWGFQKMDICA